MPRVVDAPVGDEEDYHFLYNPFRKAIVINENSPENPLKLFFALPLYAPLLFPNTSSDARDHAASERTLLSYLRLSVYLSVVSVAILLNFHLKSQPTSLEQRLSHPLGLIFFALSLLCLAAGYANYVRTVAKYARKRALVQSGVKTQVVLTVVAGGIVAACGVFLGSEAQAKGERRGLGLSLGENAGAGRGHGKGLGGGVDVLSMLSDIGGLGWDAAA